MKLYQTQLCYKDTQVFAPWQHLGNGRAHCSVDALHGEALLDLEVLTSSVLQGQSIEWRHVHLLAIADTELQLLEQGGQEKEDLPPGNGLPNALPFPQAENQHLLPICFVHFSPFGIEETVWVEGQWILPKFPGRENNRC